MKMARCLAGMALAMLLTLPVAADNGESPQAAVEAYFQSIVEGDHDRSLLLLAGLAPRIDVATLGTIIDGNKLTASAYGELRGFELVNVKIDSPSMKSYYYILRYKQQPAGIRLILYRFDGWELLDYQQMESYKTFALEAAD